MDLRIRLLHECGAGGFRCSCCNRNRDRHPATSRASKARARRAESGAVRTRIREADRREVWD
jgi:hypothetical protein